LKNVFEAENARQKWPKKHSLHTLNEHFEATLNTTTLAYPLIVIPSQACTDIFPDDGDREDLKPIGWSRFRPAETEPDRLFLFSLFDLFFGLFFFHTFGWCFFIRLLAIHALAHNFAPSLP